MHQPRELSDSPAPPCVAQRSTDGKPCRGRRLDGSDRCFAHHERAAEWRRKGGRGSSNAARAQSRLGLLRTRTRRRALSELWWTSWVGDALI